MLPTRGEYCRRSGVFPRNIFRQPANPRAGRAHGALQWERTSAPAPADRSRRETLFRAAPETCTEFSGLFPVIVVPSPLLVLHRRLGKVSIQCIELRFPERAVLGNPGFGFFQRPTGEATTTRAPKLSLRHEAGFLQNSQMLHDRRQTHAVGPGQFRNRGLAARQGHDDGAPRGVCQRLKGGVQSSIILNHSV